MGFFSLEHSKAAYTADFVVYSAAVVVMAGYLAFAGPAGLRLEMLGTAVGGLVLWSVLEYLLHRFLLHGMEPFRSWHAEHHDRPTALIGTPTIFSAGMIAAFVFLPALLLVDAWLAGALTLGVLSGYLAYTFTHHGLHHWRAESSWLKQRKLWHAKHHHHAARPGCYGVTSSFWDHVFRSTRPQRAATPAASSAMASVVTPTGFVNTVSAE